jgi:iron complex outermembrane receptor protein
MRLSARLLSTSFALTCTCALAQERTLDPVVVSASRTEERLFDTPAAVNRVSLDAYGNNATNISVSEALSSIPGISIRERQNLAQDVQLSIRGFGTRATFGVRANRILIDGIPASMPDGQGQVSTADLAYARHIEVLRGPWAQMYGNAGGGVLLIESEPPPPTPAGGVRISAGSNGFWQIMGNGGTQLRPGLGMQVAGEAFSTDGVRDHAAASRQNLDLRTDWQISDDTKLRVGLNGFSQPKAQDPLGLTKAQFNSSPYSVNALAEQFNTRKNVDQYQLGAQAEHRLGPQDRLTLTAYAGHRTLTQYLGMSGAALTSSGGVVDLSRDYYGTSIGWQRLPDFHDALPLRFSAGAEAEAMDDKRKGYVNLNGSSGALRRNEDDVGNTYGIYGQVAAYARKDLQLLAGARYSNVQLRVDDHYITSASPDDSGKTTFRQFTPVVGVLWNANDWLNLYANAGRGFETPTFAEIAYKPNSTGVNFGLQPARSRHFEAGAKAVRDNLALQTALFYSMTNSDIVPDTNSGGRATFRNVDGVRRFGLEFGAQTSWHQIDWSLAYTLLYASFTQGFTNADGNRVNPGNQLPGTARHVFQLAATWHATDDTTFGATLHSESHIFADDINSESAPGYATLGLNVGHDVRAGRTRMHLFARVDNVFDKTYSGSVIVNESNRRFYETAAGRTFLVGVSVSM